MYWCICFICIVNMINFLGGQWQLSRRFNLLCLRPISLFSCRRCPRAGFSLIIKPSPPCWSLGPASLPPWKLLQFKLGKSWDKSRRKFVLRRCFKPGRLQRAQNSCLHWRSTRFLYFIFPKPAVNQMTSQSLQVLFHFSKQFIWRQQPRVGNSRAEMGTEHPDGRWDMDTGYPLPFASHTAKKKVKGGKSPCVTDPEHFGLQGT